MRYSCNLLFFAIIAVMMMGLCLSRQETAQPESAAVVIEKDLHSMDAAGIAKKLEKMKADRERFTFDEREFALLGQKILRAENPEIALAVLNSVIGQFPQSADLHYLLAIACQANGDEDGYHTNNRKRATIRQQDALARFLEENEGKLAATAAEVIRKHLAATGGEEAWRDIKTMKVTFRMCDTSDSAMTITRYYKRPGYYRQEVVGGDSFIALDGNTTWRVRGGEWREVKEDNAYFRLSSMDEHLLDYDRNDIAYRLIGLDVLNYTPVYHLERTFGDGYREDLYFCAETGRLTEKRTPYTFGPSYFSFWDYRDVGGVYVPFAFIRSVGDFNPPHGGMIQEVVINEEMPVSMFVKPAETEVSTR